MPTMQQQPTEYRRWRKPSLKNAKSFIIKIVHLPHTKEDEPHQEDSPPPTRVPSPPPSYEATIQTASARATQPAQKPSSHERQNKLRQRLKSTSRTRLKSPEHTMYTASCLSPHLPSTHTGTAQSTTVASSVQEREGRAGLTCPTILDNSVRPVSSRQSSRGHHHRHHHHHDRTDRPNQSPKVERAHGILRRSSSCEQSNSLRPRNPNGRRDRDLLAAKKSLPVLTKYAKASPQSTENVPFF